MMWTHNLTGKEALWVTPYNSNWLNQQDPYLWRVRKWQDLPDPTWNYTNLGIPPEIYEQGKKALFYFLSAFLENNCEDFWFFILPSGFPDGIVQVNPDTKFST